MPVAELPAKTRARPSALADSPDVVLVRRLRAGDERAFEAIFKRHYAPLLAYCRHMLGSQDEGEDALQQTFIKAHQALRGGTAPRELRPWLYAIARNCCLSAIAARRPTAPLEDRTPALAGLSDQVHQREDLRELVAGIGRLPEDQRSALLLAELDDLSHQAIAAIVGCPVSKVKALVYQARSALIADRDARNTPCEDIREQLAVARGGELRRGPLRRHLKLCAGCRDFQLAVNAQRESLAAVLPVLPSAGLAATILGHGAAHAAGAAAGGTGLAASGTAATTTAVSAGAGAGGGTSIGALVGGGLVTKLAAAGAVVALATAGAVTVHNRDAQATATHRPTRSRLASNTAGRRIAAADIADSAADIPDSSSLGPGAPSSPALVNLTGGPAAPTSSGSLTKPMSLGGADPLLTPASGTLAPGGKALGGQPAVSTAQGKSGAGRQLRTAPDIRAKHRVTLRRRRRRELLLRRKSRLRRQRAAQRRARRKALKRRHPLVKPATPKPVVTPAPVPVPVRVHHRKAHPTTTPTPVTTTPAETTGARSENKERKSKRRPSATSTGTETGTGSGAAAGAGATSTETAKTGSSTAAGSTGTGETGPPTTVGPKTKSHPKKQLVEEEQLPNLEGEREVTGVDVHKNPTENSTGGTHNASS